MREDKRMVEIIRYLWKGKESELNLRKGKKWMEGMEQGVRIYRGRFREVGHSGRQTEECVRQDNMTVPMT